MKNVIKKIVVIAVAASVLLPTTAFATGLKLKTTDKKIVKRVEKGELNHDELADLTILGIFGNGEERVELFKKYKLNLEKVQDIVNEKLSSQVLTSEVYEPEVEVEEVQAPTQKVYQSNSLYSLRDLQFHGVINWNGYKFTYYSSQILPGGGLNIPGRHINASGYVADGDGYIVVASNPNIPKGTVINTPFGYQGKVYDRCGSCTLNWYDIYTK